MNDNINNWGGLSQYRNELYGLAIIWIMLFHANATNSTYPGILEPIISHSLGVSIFLFLSGVSLCYSKEKKNEPLSLYYGKRLKRVYIPLIFDLLYWIVLLFIKRITFADFVTNVLCLRFWLTGDQQIWFISAILVMYLLFPYLYSFIYGEAKDADQKNTGNVMLKTGVLVLSLFILFYLIKAETPNFFDNSIIALSRFPTFVLGIGFGRKVIYNKKIEISDYVVGLISFIVVCFMGIARGVLKIPFFVDMPYYYIQVFMVIPAMIILSFAVNVFRIKPVSKFFKWFGSMSLELYIVHITMIYIYRDSIPYKYEDGNILKYLGVIAISVAVAYIWNRIITFSKKKISARVVSSTN